MLQEVSTKSIIVRQGSTTKILHYTEPASLFFVDELKIVFETFVLESLNNFRQNVIMTEGLLLTTSTIYENVCFEGDAYRIIEELEILQKEHILSDESKEKAKKLFEKMGDILNESFAGGEKPIFVDFGR